MVKRPTEECMGCSGKGEVKDWADDMFGNTTTFWHTCDYCEGTGEVTREFTTEELLNLLIENDLSIELSDHETILRIRAIIALRGAKVLD